MCLIYSSLLICLFLVPPFPHLLLWKSEMNITYQRYLTIQYSTRYFVKTLKKKPFIKHIYMVSDKEKLYSITKLLGFIALLKHVSALTDPTDPKSACWVWGFTRMWTLRVRSGTPWRPPEGPQWNQDPQWSQVHPEEWHPRTKHKSFSCFFIHVHNTSRTSSYNKVQGRQTCNTHTPCSKHLIKISWFEE